MKVSEISIGDDPIHTATTAVYGLYSYWEELVDFK